jgi:hypothetical protein
MLNGLPPGPETHLSLEPITEVLERSAGIVSQVTAQWRQGWCVLAVS